MVLHLLYHLTDLEFRFKIGVCFLAFAECVGIPFEGIYRIVKVYVFGLLQSVVADSIVVDPAF